MKFARLFLTLIAASFSFSTNASYSQGNSSSTGGDGFNITKFWGGSPGTALRVEYYGALAEQCNASQSSGSSSRINFFIKFNGRLVATSETSCEMYMTNDGPRKYAVVELTSDDGQAAFRRGKIVPWLFQDTDMSRSAHVEIWIQSVTGQWDSRGGQNYHFNL